MPPSPPKFSFPADVPERLSTLRSSIDLPVSADHPALVRYAPFGDRREIVLRRGPERMTFQHPAFELGRRTVRLGAHDVVVVAIQQVLSPPVPPPGVPMRSPAELEYHYKPVLDAVFLPDGELLVTRTPNGFSDAEVALIFSRIRVADAGAPPGAGTAGPLVPPPRDASAGTPPRDASGKTPKPAAKPGLRARLGGLAQIGFGLAVWAVAAVLAGSSGVYSGRVVFFGTALVSLGLLTVATPGWIRWVRPPTPPGRQLLVAVLLVAVLLVEQRIVESWLGFD
jgi:hypothetical protein